MHVPHLGSQNPLTKYTQKETNIEETMKYSVVNICMHNAEENFFDGKNTHANQSICTQRPISQIESKSHTDFIPFQFYPIGGLFFNGSTNSGEVLSMHLRCRNVRKHG